MTLDKAGSGPLTCGRSKKSAGGSARGRLAIWVSCALLTALTVPGAAQATTQTFTYTGGEQTFTVPAGVSVVEVLAIGGHGGSGSNAPNGPGGVPGAPGSLGRPGGVADEVRGQLSVTPGETLYVEVGGNGQEGLEYAGSEGGFNGGGEGGVLAGGGGGASDVRTSPRAAGLSPDSRLLVAGAGGGGGGTAGPTGGGSGGSAGEAGEISHSGN